MSIDSEAIIIDEPRKDLQTTAALETEFLLILGIYFCLLWVLLAKQNFHLHKNVPTCIGRQRVFTHFFKRHLVVS